MKHSKLHQALAMATVLGGASVGLFAPSAGAVNLSQQGLGEVLIFPYYTSRDNWSTLLSVINTQDTTLAVRFRIHEARNSRDVQDFTVVLSPYDVFAGTISADTAGLTSFTPASGDKTCIVADGTKPSPYVYPTTIPFKVSGFTSGNTDGGPGIEYPANPAPAIDRLREGYVEVFVMGHAAATTEIAKDAKHAPLGAPPGCGKIVAAFSKANILKTARQFGEPVNALKGNYSFVNSARGVSAGGTAVALANFVDIPTVDSATGLTIPAPARPACGGATPVLGTPSTGTGHMFLEPAGSLATSQRNFNWDPSDNGGNSGDCPNLISAQAANDFYEPTLADTYPSEVFYLDDTNPRNSAGNLMIPEFGSVTQFDTGYGYGFVAVAEALRASALVNQWANSNTPLRATTEWVVTHPTKYFYVDRSQATAGAVSYQRFPVGRNYANGNTMPIAPFAQVFAAPGQSCVDVGLNLWDRDENGTAPNPGSSPGDPSPLCYEANVVQFDGNASNSIFGSKVKLDLSGYVANAVTEGQILSTPQNGWMRMNLAYSPTAQKDLSRRNNPLLGDGLPAVGFAISQRNNGNPAQSYAYLVDHAYEGRGVATDTRGQEQVWPPNANGDGG